MSRNAKILTLAVLACANIALLAYIGLRKSVASVSPAAQREIDRLPSVEITADSGARVRLDQLPGRVRLVQFISPRIDAQVSAASKTVAEFGAGQVSFVLITNDARGL